MERRGFLKRAGVFAAGAMLAKAGIAGAEAQETKLETQESKIPMAEEIAAMTRDTILSLKKEHKTLWERDSTTDELRKRIFGNQDLTAGIRAYSNLETGAPAQGHIEKLAAIEESRKEVLRAHGEFLSRSNDYFEATEKAIRAGEAEKEYESEVERLRSLAPEGLKIPDANIPVMEDKALANAELMRGLALTLARANDKLLSLQNIYLRASRR
jgi:hypothetical protein